jgi:hypothetical protein
MATESVAASAAVQANRVQPPAAPQPARSSKDSAGTAPGAKSTATQRSSVRLANVATTSGRQVDINA